MKLKRRMYFSHGNRVRKEKKKKRKKKEEKKEKKLNK